jgi:adenine-specific DNA-methyltransferase
MINTNSKIHKNKYGQYFTPNLIADFMIGLADIEFGSKILEPSSGTGVFLDLLQKKGFENISAYEIDEDLSQKHDFVKNENFLSANIHTKFDLIIGNPPYIRWKNLENELKDELANNHLWNKYFNSLCDYSYLFILKSIELLEQNGQLIFITPEYWFNTMHSLSLRNYMLKHGYFEEIYHFNETPIFENATVSTIIFKYIKTKSAKPKQINIVKYYDSTKLTIKKLTDIKNRKNGTKISIFQSPQFQENQRWLLTDVETIKKMQVFENSCKKQNKIEDFLLFKTDNTIDYHTIGEFCDIANGMVSGLDKAFQLNGEKLNSNEKKHRLKVIKAKDLQPFSYQKITNYIFANEISDESDFKIDFPNFYQKLQDFKPKLEKRYQYNRQINYWAWTFMRSFKLFNTDKNRLFVPCKERISNKNYFRFAYVETGIFPTQDVTAIFKKERVKESLHYILAILNNHRVFEWLKYNGVVKGNIVEFSEKPIASIPFRAIDWQNENEIQLHDKITQLCKNYIMSQSDELLEQLNREIDHLFKPSQACNL